MNGQRKKMIVNGVQVLVPPLSVSHTYHCSHIVSIDGQPMEAVLAVQYLLVRCDQLRTEIADLKSGADDDEPQNQPWPSAPSP